MKKHMRFWIAVLVAALATTAAVTLRSKQEEAPAVVPVEEPVSEVVVEDVSGSTLPALEDLPEGRVSTVPVSWQTYRSDDGFSIRYPETWRVVNELDASRVDEETRVPLRVSFGTGTYGEHGYDGEWFVIVYDVTERDANAVIDGMGDQFADRQVSMERLTIDGAVARRVTVTTPTYPEWSYEAVVVERDGYVYFVHNGAVPKDGFDAFYSSLRFE